MNNWVKLLNRECSLAFQVEVPLANRSALPKAIGIPINNFWCESITFGVYYKGFELKELAEVIKNKIISNPSFAKDNISNCYKLGDILLKSSDVANTIQLNNFTNSDLLTLLNRFRETYLNFLPYLVYPHAIERYFMKIISVELKDHLISIKKVAEFDRIYEILTTPTIHEVDEQIDLLKVSIDLKKHGLTQKTKKLIEEVKNKYDWQPFWTITAKPLTFDYFKNAVEALADSNNNLIDEIASINQGQKERKKNLLTIFKETKAPKTLKAYVELLQGYMYLRTYRKNIISKAHFLHMPLLTEISRRMEIGNDITLISYEEMIAYLKNGEVVSKKVIDERKDAWAVLSIDGQISIISGKKSVEGVASKYGIEDVKQQASQKQVKGQAACLGKATGRARIIKNIREFGKIKRGDVLITPMTTPDYVPVMKKVAAIVTDEGGVTCHAAIVSREFNIPCIVGTSNATKVFCDGDLVEVDANTGIAKIV